MPVWPAEKEDTVLYESKEIVADRDITVRMIDNSILNLFGTIWHNGQPIHDGGGRVDVRSFGCRCDGGNDAPELQAAIDSGYPLIVPKNVKVSVGAMIIVPSGMDLQIDGRIERIWTSTQSGGASAMFYGGSLNKDLPRITNVKIHGMGSVGCPSLMVGKGIVFCLGLDDSLIENITIDTYYGGQAFLVMGHRLRMHGVKVINSAVTAGTGGLRFCGGDDFVATNCHIESGDDCLQFVPGEVQPSLDSRRGSYIGCTGFSTLGRFIAVISAGSSEAIIEDCSFISCHGKASNRAVVIDVIENAKGSVRRIAVTDCSVDNTSAGAGVAPGSIFVKNQSSEMVNGTEIRDIWFNRFTIIGPWAEPIAAESVTGLVFNGCHIDNDRDPAVATPSMSFSACHNLTFSNNQIYVSRPANYAFQLTGGCNGVRIENNDFRNMADTAGSLRIYTASDVQIRGNSWHHAPGGTTIYACVRIEATNVNEHIIENNDFSNILAFSGSPIVVAFGNRVYTRNNKGNPNPYVTAVTAYVPSPYLVMYGLVQMTSNSAKTFQIQDDTKAGFPLGSYVDVLSTGLGNVTIMAQAGSTLTFTGTLTIGQNQIARITKIAANAYHSVVWT